MLMVQYIYGERERDDLLLGLTCVSIEQALTSSLTDLTIRNNSNTISRLLDSTAGKWGGMVVTIFGGHIVHMNEAY